MKNHFLTFLKRHNIPAYGIEIGAKSLYPHNSIEVAFGVFDCLALGIHLDENKSYKYARLRYPSLEEARQNANGEVDHIHHCRYAHQIGPHYQIQLDDLAVCFGDLDWITKDVFCEELKKGMAKMSICPKHLHIFKEEGDFLDAFDGMIHAIADAKGEYLCDLHEKDLVEFLESGDVLSSLEAPYPKAPSNASDMFLADHTDRDKIYNSRIEIIRMQ